MKAKTYLTEFETNKFKQAPGGKFVIFMARAQQIKVARYTDFSFTHL